MTDARGLEQPERPDGSLAGHLWECERQFVAVEAHATHEGHDVDSRAVLEGYDRALHPWMHGRRPHDLVERVRSWIDGVLTGVLR